MFPHEITKAVDVAPFVDPTIEFVNQVNVKTVEGNTP